MKNTIASNPGNIVPHGNNERKQEFKKLLRDYEQAVANAKNSRVDETRDTLLYKIAQILAISGLKKASENATEPDAIKKLERELRKARVEPYKSDVVQTACEKLWQVTRAYGADGGEWLEYDIIAKIPRKRVLYGHDILDYIEIAVKPIQLVRKAVNSYIDGERGIRANVSCYSFGVIAEKPSDSIDPIADLIDTVYYRAHKCADVGGYNVDNLYTTNIDDIIKYELVRDTICKELTQRQRFILDGLEQGLSYSKIADRLKVSKQAVNKHVLTIRKVCENIGFTVKTKEKDGEK